MKYILEHVLWNMTKFSEQDFWIKFPECMKYIPEQNFQNKLSTEMSFLEQAFRTHMSSKKSFLEQEFFYSSSFNYNVLLLFFFFSCNGDDVAATTMMVTTMVGCSEGEADGEQFDHFTQLWGAGSKMGGAGSNNLLKDFTLLSPLVQHSFDHVKSILNIFLLTPCPFKPPFTYK